MEQTTVKTSKELAQDHTSAVERVRELESESKSLDGRITEAYQLDAQRRASGEEVNSESVALLRRREELPYDIRAARVAAAELEVELRQARRAEKRQKYEELTPGVELAEDGAKDAEEHHQSLKAERERYAESSMDFHDLRRAMDALDRLGDG